ncbi:MAG: hypothetical protein RLO81_06745 [Fulvivirga sp.]|uniref:hypothetical protein n=1 Tax=Fulvivirga sp. TaxID=1931237 RepID=UPI0032EE042A
MIQNTSYQRFILIAAISCFLSVITTLGIHSSLFDLGELSLEDRYKLFENSKYIVNRYWVIIHCLFVLISMLGFLLIQFKKSPGFTILGFTFFAVFSFTEIFRQMFVLFYLNNLRRSYFETNDVAIQEIIRINIDHAGLISYALFGLFIVAFALGNICYGISLITTSKLNNILAYLLIFWGLGNLTAFGNEFLKSENLNVFIEYFSIIYQPIMRILVAFWILSKFKEIRIEIATANKISN